MTRSLVLIVIGSIFAITFPLGARTVDVKKKKADSVPSPPATHVAAGNHFAFDLYGKLRTDKTGENLFFSPTSISLALSMTYAGARGDTAKQMAGVLHWDGDPAGLHAGMGDYLRHLNAIDQSQQYQLRVANRLWAQQGYKFLADFLTITRERYGAEMGPVDFANQTEAARQAINHWVGEQTAGKIENLIPSGVLEPRTKLVLTNAIYFKGNWQTPFKKESTRDEDFQLASTKKTRVPMMQVTERFGFARHEGMRVLQMPYEGGQLSMVFVLSDNIEGLAALEDALSPDAWKKWTATLRSREVWVRLPRFKMTSEFGLNRALSDLGMPLAFEEGAADFSGMNGKSDLFIAAALHKAFVDVNEEGTEAAAATGIVFAPTSAIKRDEPEKFHADHPFLFAIVDNRSGGVLFLGRAMDPTK